MGFLSGLGGLVGGLFGGGGSSSFSSGGIANKTAENTNTTTTTNTDQRIVAGEGAIVVGPEGRFDQSIVSESDDDFFAFSDSSSRYSYADNSQRAQLTDSRDLSTWFAFSDSSDRSDRRDMSSESYSYASDSSNRSVTNITGVDPNYQRFRELDAQLFGALAESQTEGARFLVNAGRDVLLGMGGSITDLYERAGSNTTRAWESTLRASTDTLDRIVAQTSEANRTAASLASTAMSTYQPAENQAADVSMKLGMIAAALAALIFLSRKAA